MIGDVRAPAVGPEVARPDEHPRACGRPRDRRLVVVAVGQPRGAVPHGVVGGLRILPRPPADEDPGPVVAQHTGSRTGGRGPAPHQAGVAVLHEPAVGLGEPLAHVGRASQDGADARHRRVLRVDAGEGGCRGRPHLEHDVVVHRRLLIARAGRGEGHGGLGTHAGAGLGDPGGLAQELTGDDDPLVRHEAVVVRHVLGRPVVARPELQVDLRGHPGDEPLVLGHPVQAVQRLEAAQRRALVPAQPGEAAVGVERVEAGHLGDEHVQRGGLLVRHRGAHQGAHPTQRVVHQLPGRVGDRRPAPRRRVEFRDVERLGRFQLHDHGLAVADRHGRQPCAGRRGGREAVARDGGRVQVAGCLDDVRRRGWWLGRRSRSGRRGDTDSRDHGEHDCERRCPHGFLNSTGEAMPMASARQAVF